MIRPFLEKNSHTGRKYFLISDVNAHHNCIRIVEGMLPALTGEFILEPGEHCKTLEKAMEIWAWLLNLEAGRDDILINLGGGVVTDLGGFAASAYKRGIEYMNIPTTLIGMADAAVGGKTGVNVKGGKNLVGSFYHPVAVFIDLKFLETLPQEHLRSGFAELFKCALIAGDRHYEHTMKSRWQDGKELRHLVRMALDVKSAYVKRDPEDHGARKALNFGHTLGHAFETLSVKKNPPGLIHGDAIALGMIGEAFLSWRVTGLNWAKMQEFTGFLRKNFPALPFTADDFDEIIYIMNMDKKNRAGNIRFSLLKDTGDPVWDVECEEQHIRKAFDFMLKEK